MMSKPPNGKAKSLHRSISLGDTKARSPLVNSKEDYGTTSTTTGGNDYENRNDCNDNNDYDRNKNNKSIVVVASRSLSPALSRRNDPNKRKQHGGYHIRSASTSKIKSASRGRRGGKQTIGQTISAQKWMRKLKPHTRRNSNSGDLNITNTNANTVTANANTNANTNANANDDTHLYNQKKHQLQRQQQQQHQPPQSQLPQSPHQPIQNNNNSPIGVRFMQSPSDDETCTHRYDDNDDGGGGGGVSHNDHDSDDSVCTYSSNEYDPESSRLTAIVWKRKSGWGNIMKSRYVKASERANTLGMNTVSNFQKLMKGTNTNSDTYTNANANTHTSTSTATATATATATNSNMMPTSPTNVSSNTGSSSGIGQPGNIKIWEKRRIILEGDILMYFHQDADIDIVIDEHDHDHEEDEEKKTLPSTPPPTTSKGNKNFTKFKKKVAEFSNATFSTNNSNTTQTTENEQLLKTTSNSAINTPRGLIDLVATHATASVTHFSQFSHPPTPYSLSILGKSETKWVLCFESSKELLTWLGALTDISLKQSMQAYKLDHGQLYRTGGNVDRGGVVASNETSYNSGLVENDNVGNNDISNRDRTMEQVSQSSIGGVKSISSSSISGNDPGVYITMAIFNSVLLLFSFLLKDTATMASYLTVQVILNGVTWCYFYYGYKKRLSFAANTEKVNEIGTSTNALQSSISPPSQKRSIRGRSFSSDKRKKRDHPSFVERTKDECCDESDNIQPYKPLAGKSTIQFKNAEEVLSRKDETTGWIAVPPSSMQVRGAGYLIDKKKVPSPTSLYELIEVDAFDSEVQMLDVGTKFKLPEVKFDIPQGHWRAPNLLVISFSLPTTAPKLGKSSDNKGYIVIGYYRMRDETRKVLEIISNPEMNDLEQEQKCNEVFPDKCDRQRINSVKLWEKWCRCAPTDLEMEKRLKFIPRGDNFKEIGVPSWMLKYNGKPMLMKRPGSSSFVFSHQDESMIEIDINMHPYPYMFKQSMTYLKDHYFPQLLMTFGFIIEGREEDELPEVLLGNPLQLAHVIPKNVMKSRLLFTRPSI